MKITCTWLFFAIGLLLNGFAQGQSYAFTDNNLNPYKQDFNTFTGTVAMTGNQVAASPELYAEAEFGPGNSYNYLPPSFASNDGNTPAANYYHFGDASGANSADRAFGGIGGFVTGTTSGIGYVGIRFKNGTTATIIKNLEISYAMEQWFNSTYNTAAQVSVSYLILPSVSSLREATGTWTDIPALAVNAPSTATTIGARDGNAAANRRLASTTLSGINLAVGDEIMIRWSYALNANTNGNGLSIDDVVVTPETNVFYSAPAGNLDVLANWHTQPDGGGITPADFSSANQTFYVQSPDATTPVERQSGTTWTVSGDNSKIVVGTAAVPATLRLGNSKNIVGTIDVSKDSYFYNNHPTSPGFTLGNLAPTSLVEYISSTIPQAVQAGQYGNLKINGGNAGTDRSTNPKSLAGTTVVAGTLTIADGSNLVLGDHNLTVLGSFPTFSATAYVVADGKGRLRMLVPRASSTSAPGTVVKFPVGGSFTLYNPVTLQQTSTDSDDIFEVRVLNGVAKTYDASNAPGAVPIASEVVNKTWLIGKEVPANPTKVGMTLQWSASEATANFINAQAHINHYTGGAWDVYKAELGVTGAGPYVATRTGITSFSPFSVSSRVDGALPVELVSFEARRTGATVAVAWATASEKNSAYFTVERSVNGAEFEGIGTVKGAGASTQRLDYAFEDKTPLPGTAYYRLRQTDTDGTFSFAPVVAVKGTVAAQAVAVPNPSTGRFEIWTPAAEVVATEVTTVLGTRVNAAATATPAGTLRFDLSAQPAGLYFVRLQLKTGTQMVRVVRN
ncbi:hypothetical protein ACVWYF_003816 [Hymenobacter sp. UYAg731]